MADKFCPVCKYKNEASASVCVFCGSPLEQLDGEIPSTTRNVDAGAIHPAGKEPPARDYLPPKQGLALYTIESEVPIIVQDESSFVLGRRMTGEIDELFVDLKPYGAYESGVSRRHAMIRRTGKTYEIVDLGSTNGTWLDRERIVPNRPYPLKSGAVIFLGRLQLFVVYQETKD